MTCTDTLSILASIGYAKNQKQKLAPWSSFAEAYMSDRDTHTASYIPERANRWSISQELDWLESLAEIERASVERVEAAGIFADVTTADIRTAAMVSAKNQEVRLRLGLNDLLQVLRNRKGSASIISVNWSGQFIEEFLIAASGVERLGWPFKGIYANQITSGPSGKLDRHFPKEKRGIWTARDKSRVLEEVLAEQGGRETTVYVGDSLTDLDCLLSVDIGICVKDEMMGGEQKSIAEALDRLGIPCRWICEYLTPSQCDEVAPPSTGKTLWWARNFKEIAESALFVA